MSGECQTVILILDDIEIHSVEIHIHLGILLLLG